MLNSWDAFAFSRRGSTVARWKYARRGNRANGRVTATPMSMAIWEVYPVLSLIWPNWEGRWRFAFTISTVWSDFTAVAVNHFRLSAIRVVIVHCLFGVFSFYRPDLRRGCNAVCCPILHIVTDFGLSQSGPIEPSASEDSESIGRND